MKSDREALEEAIGLIENPEHWTQGAYGRDRDGANVDPGGNIAQSWCAVGALKRSCVSHLQLERTIWAIVGAVHAPSLIAFNDKHLHSEVVLLMKQGLDRLPPSEQQQIRESHHG